MSKYNNRKTVFDDIVFDSKDESLYYEALKIYIARKFWKRL